jgi:hypothetical protein
MELEGIEKDTNAGSVRNNFNPILELLVNTAWNTNNMF